MNSQNRFRFDGKTTPLNNLCIEIVDCHHSTPNWTESGKLVVRNFNIRNGRLQLSDTSFTDEETYKERIRRSKPESGDLIITREAPMGEVCIIPEGVECCLGQRMVLIKPDVKKVGSKYLLYALQSEFVQKQIKKSDKTGSIVSNLRIPVLKELLIPSFDIIREQRIGEILDAIVSKIELNNRINAELEAIAKTIYDYWFVQFDFPNKNGKPYKASGGKMAWSKELKREIPEGWEVKKFSDWIQADKNGDWGKESEVGNYTLKVNCVRGTDINGLNGLEQCDPPLRYILEKNSNKVLNPFDLIVEISGGSPVQSTGRLAYITEETLTRFENPLICSNFCKAITLKNQKYIYNFVYYWQLLYRKGVFFGYEGKTSGIKNLLFESFMESHWATIPNEAAVNSFYDVMKGLQAKKQIALIENQKLTELRDWLLPMLMNGQIKIKDAESEMTMAAEPESKYGEGKRKIVRANTK
jgi:type I restriction enzyme S subunit